MVRCLTPLSEKTGYLWFRREVSVIFHICIRGGPNFSIRTRRLTNRLHAVLKLANLGTLHVIGHCSIRNVSRRLFSRAIPAIFDRPRISGITCSLPSFTNTGIFTARFLPNRFSRHTSSTTRYVRLVSRNRHPAIHSTGLCTLRNSLASTSISAVGRCIVGPIRTHRTDLRAGRALGARIPIPNGIRAVTNFGRVSTRTNRGFVSRHNLTVSLTSLRFYRGCFDRRDHRPAVARVGIVSAC